MVVFGLLFYENYLCTSEEPNMLGQIFSWVRHSRVNLVHLGTYESKHKYDIYTRNETIHTSIIYAVRKVLEVKAE